MSEVCNEVRTASSRRTAAESPLVLGSDQNRSLRSELLRRTNGPTERLSSPLAINGSGPTHRSLSFAEHFRSEWASRSGSRSKKQQT
jgi:hypothetical protein